VGTSTCHGRAASARLARRRVRVPSRQPDLDGSTWSDSDPVDDAAGRALPGPRGIPETDPLQAQLRPPSAAAASRTLAAISSKRSDMRVSGPAMEIVSETAPPAPMMGLAMAM
jgi:hypothetical protein